MLSVELLGVGKLHTSHLDVGDHEAVVLHGSHNLADIFVAVGLDHSESPRLETNLLLSLDFELLAGEDISIVHDFELSAEDVDDRTDVEILGRNLGVGSLLEEGFAVFDVPHVDGVVFGVVAQLVGLDQRGCGVEPLCNEHESVFTHVGLPFLILKGAGVLFLGLLQNGLPKTGLFGRLLTIL